MEKITAGRDSLGKFAPKFAELNDDVLFGEVWSREDKLSPRDRSLITVTALMTSGIFDSSLSYHMQKAKENGVSRTEIAEILTQLAFYSGWPKAWAAFRLAKEVWTENCGTAEEFAKTSLFPVGEPNTAFGQYFTGNSYLKILSGKLGMTVANVTFEPRCRNNWHIHKAESGGGQILLCTEGEGWYQEWENPREDCTRATWWKSPRESNIGTARQKTNGFPISRWKFPARELQMNGWNLFPKKITKN